MDMIIGGAFQGKAKLAKNTYPEISWKSGKELTEEELLHAEGVLGFHGYIKKELEQGREVTSLAKKLIEKNPKVILVSDEVGYGVVPMDASERAFREAVGRVCTELAGFSSRVTRVVCGIGTVIKDA